VAHNSVTAAVASVLSEMAFVQFALKNDLINHSALARFIKPAVEEKLKKKSTIDALIMAVRRYSRGLREDFSSQALLRILNDLKLNLHTGMVSVSFSRSSGVYSKLIELEKSKVNWRAGDKMYVVQTSNEIVVVTTQKLLPLIHSEFDRDEIMGEFSGLALLAVEYSVESLRVPGVLAFITGQLASANVNILCIFSSTTSLRLLVAEADAPKAYDRLRKALEESGRALQLVRQAGGD